MNSTGKPLTLFIIFLCVGSVCAWFSAPTHLIEEWRLAKGPAEKTEGHILAEEKTHSSVNKKKVYEYTFSYGDRDGVRHRGTAYTTGSKWAENAPVEVAYLLNDASIACPTGARMDVFGKASLMVMMFPLIGLVGIISILSSRRKNRGLLLPTENAEAHGIFGYGSLRKNFPGEATIPLTRQKQLDELDGFLQSPPPRRIPASILKATAPPISVKHTMIVCSLMTLFGLFLASVFAPLHLISEWRLEKGPVKSVPGRVVTAEETGSRENGSRVYQCTFFYQTEDGRARQGTAYRKGSSWRENEKLMVTYLSSDPSVALPKGARMDPFGKGGLLVLLFPVLALLAIFKALRDDSIRRDILQNGKIAQAKVSIITKSIWHRANNGRQTLPAYKVTMRHSETDAPLTGNVTDPRQVELLTQHFHSEEPVTILHLPHKPKRFLLPDMWRPVI